VGKIKKAGEIEKKRRKKKKKAQAPRHIGATVPEFSNRFGQVADEKGETMRAVPRELSISRKKQADGMVKMVGYGGMRGLKKSTPSLKAKRKGKSSGENGERGSGEETIKALYPKGLGS